MYQSDLLIAAENNICRLRRGRLVCRLLKEEGILAKNSSVLLSLADILLDSYLQSERFDSQSSS